MVGAFLRIRRAPKARNGAVPHPAEGVILPQGVAGEFVRHQDAAQVGMAGELDAEQVVDLALHPVGTAPDIKGAGQARGRVVSP